MKLRFLCLFLIVINMLSMTGCWDYKDYDDLTLVEALGIDVGEQAGEITVTVQYNISGGKTSIGRSQGTNKGSSQNLPSVGTATAKGPSITEALSKIQESRRKELFYAYMEVVVLGEPAAKTLTQQVIQFFDRTANVRSSVYIVFTKEKAEDVLSTLDPNLSAAPAKAIRGQVDQAVKAGTAFPVTIEDFAEKLTISGTEPAAPQVTAVKTEEGESASSETSSETGVVNFSEMKEGYTKIDGIAVFQSDQLIGWLDKTESTGFGYILNKDMTPYEDVSPTGSDSYPCAFTFLIVKAKSKIKTSLQDGNPVISVSMSLQADLKKNSESLEVDSMTPAVLHEMEALLSEKVKSEMEAAVHKGQDELKTDIFGFGFEFYRQHPSLWHKQYEAVWSDLFPSIPISVTVTSKIINTGTSIKKFNSR